MKQLELPFNEFKLYIKKLSSLYNIDLIYMEHKGHGDIADKKFFKNFIAHCHHETKTVVEYFVNTFNYNFYIKIPSSELYNFLINYNNYEIEN